MHNHSETEGDIHPQGASTAELMDWSSTAFEPVAIEADPPVDAVPDPISEDLWLRAYQELGKREPELLEDYERHIGARQDLDVPSADESSPARSKLLASPDTVKRILQTLQDERKSKQWKFSIRSKNHKVKDQLERLVKLLALADGVIKQVTSAQPYAALAWSAVSILLPVS